MNLGDINKWLLCAVLLLGSMSAQAFRTETARRKVVQLPLSSRGYALAEQRGQGLQDTLKDVRAVDWDVDADYMDDAKQKQVEKAMREQFVPDPTRALWLAAVCPGLGQIYNRKYWKLPIFYGGFLGCTYALMWNNQMYHDYAQAYMDIMDDDPNTKSYMDMLPPNYNINGREEHFKKIFKSRKDKYRRWRDMSTFAFIGVYALSIVDAYVDAELSQFDISPDLSMQLEPAVLNSSGVASPSAAYGVGCSLKF